MVEKEKDLGKKISYKEVVSEFEKFIDRGISSPDELDMEDSEVARAYEIFENWQEQIDGEAGESEDLQIRASLAKTMMFVDAGFDDSGYLEEVLEEHLMQESQNAKKIEGDFERKETRRQIAEAMVKVRKKLQ